MQITPRRHTTANVVAKRQWLVSNGTHEGENTLVA